MSLRLCGVIDCCGLADPLKLAPWLPSCGIALPPGTAVIPGCVVYGVCCPRVVEQVQDHQHDQVGHLPVISPAFARACLLLGRPAPDFADRHRNFSGSGNACKRACL